MVGRPVVDRPVQVVPQSPALMEKGNYRHFMEKEIHDQPEGCQRTIAAYVDALGGLTATLVAREWTLRLTRRVLGAVSPALADKVIGLVTAFVDGLAMLKSPWHVAQFFLRRVLPRFEEFSQDTEAI